MLRAYWFIFQPHPVPQSLRVVFGALEGKLFSLVNAWTPVRRPPGQSKNTLVKRGGGGWGRVKTRLKIGGDGGSLPEVAREIMLSVADAGVNIEVCPAARHVCICLAIRNTPWWRGPVTDRVPPITLPILHCMCPPPIVGPVGGRPPLLAASVHRRSEGPKV